MNQQKFGYWLQMAATVGVLVGLILVIWELRQAHETASAQLISDDFSAQADRWSKQMGEDPNLVVAKSCDAPESLTTADMEALNAFFHSQLIGALRMRKISEVSDYYSDENWRNWATTAMRTIASHAYGRFWWSRIRNWYQTTQPDLVSIGDSEVGRFYEDPRACATEAHGFHEWLEEDRDQTN